MDVRCPVPLKNAWSPAGYRVVEVASENGEPPTAAASSTTPEPACAPSSPVGYRVVQVANQEPKPRRLEPLPAPATNAGATQNKAQPAEAKKRHEFTWKPQRRYSVIWVPFVIGGICLAATACVCIVYFASGELSAHKRDGGPKVAAVPPGPALDDIRIPPPRPEDAADGRPDPGVGIRIPEKPADPGDVLPPAGPAFPAIGDPGKPVDPAKPADPPKPVDVRADCETFGTAIGFVRNPLEAGWLAAGERKLIFILHVSGNFEDAGFT